jgi:hypothetical protein
MMCQYMCGALGCVGAEKWKLFHLEGRRGDKGSQETNSTPTAKTEGRERQGGRRSQEKPERNSPRRRGGNRDRRQTEGQKGYKLGKQSGSDKFTESSTTKLSLRPIEK